MAKLLVVGATNTDLVANVDRAPDAGETVMGGTFGEYGGGKGANQAVAAARSGADVALLSALGNDDFGARRLAALEADGIDTRAVVRVDDASSGVAIIIVESSGENRICDLPGAREHLVAGVVLDAYKAVNPSAILATNELPHECLTALFRAAQTESVPIWFSAAPYSRAARDLLPYVDTLIVNRGEAEDLLDARTRGLDVPDLAAGLRSLGVGRVILTLGSKGVRAMSEGVDIGLDSHSVPVVDTTGAGDTFAGAWAAATMLERNDHDALVYANAAAALSVSVAGAQSSIPMREAVVDFMKTQTPRE